MDEPFAALDAQTRKSLQDELLRIWEATGKTILFITHGIDEAIYLGQRVAVLTSRPCRIKKIVDVEIDRTVEDGRSEEGFCALRHHIWSLLHTKWSEQAGKNLTPPQQAKRLTMSSAIVATPPPVDTTAIEAQPPVRSLLGLITLTIVAAVAGCSPSPNVDPSTFGPAAGGLRTIVYGHQQEPPCIFGGWIEQGYLSYQVIDNLVSLDKNYRVVPWLAESWRVSPDNLTWTFTLRDGPRFSDGNPVDAEAVAYNFAYWADGGNSTALAWIGGYYESAEVIDHRTVAVHLSRPYPRFAENLTQPYFGIQSKHALQTRSDEGNCAKPIGSGPFTVTEWNRGYNVILDRRKDYDWAPANAQHPGPALVDRVDWRFITDPTARTAALRAGEVDAIYDVQAFEWANLEKQGYELHRYVTAGRPQQISFNTIRGPFTDERLRKAFAYSLDRRAVVDAVGKSVIPFEGNGPVSQSTPAYSQAAAGMYHQDRTKAVALLEEAGWMPGPGGVRVKDGRPLEVTFPYAINRTINQDGSAIIQVLQRQAEAVGFRVKLVPYPPSAAAAGAYSGPNAYDVSIGYWTAISAGILYLNWRQNLKHAPNPANSAFYNDPELEALIVTANSDPDRRRQDELYRRAQDYIAEHALSIGVYDRLSTLAVKPTLKGVWQENSQGGPVFRDAHFE